MSAVVVLGLPATREDGGFVQDQGFRSAECRIEFECSGRNGKHLTETAGASLSAVVFVLLAARSFVPLFHGFTFLFDLLLGCFALVTSHARVGTQ